MLVKDIDALVVAQQEKKLAAVVNFVGQADDQWKEKLKEFGEKHGLKKVPLAVSANATEKFKISDEAEVTVMLYLSKKVRFNHALPKGALDQAAVAAILEDAKKLLREADKEAKEKAKQKKPKEKPKPKEKAEAKERPEAKEKPEPKEELRPNTEKDRS